MILHTPVKVLFSLFGINFYLWGVVFVLSFLLAFLLGLEASKKRIGQENFLNISVIVLIGTIIGTRLLYVLMNLGFYLQDPIKILAFSEGGSASFGGIILSLLLILWYCKHKKLSFLKILDFMAPYAVLGLALGRIGCFFNWCCYGIASNLPWAVQVAGDVARHPTQIYLLLANLIVFFILIAIRRYKEKNPKHLGIFNITGSTFFSFLFLYCLNRFFIDFIRAYQAHEFFLGLAITQWFCIIAIAVSVLFFIFSNLRKKKNIVTKK